MVPKGLHTEGGVVFFAQLGVGLFLLLERYLFRVGHTQIDFVASAVLLVAIRRVKAHYVTSALYLD